MRSVCRRSSERAPRARSCPPVGCGPLVAAHLRREDDPVAVPASGEPAPDDRLRAAVLDQVGVRGVDEVAARAGVRVEDGVRLRLVGGPAEHVAAEAEREHVEVGASESGHVPTRNRCRGAAMLRPRPDPPSNPASVPGVAFGSSAWRWTEGCAPEGMPAHEKLPVFADRRCEGPGCCWRNFASLARRTPSP